MASSDILPQHVPGGTEETTKLSQESQSPDQNMNTGLPEGSKGIFMGTNYTNYDVHTHTASQYNWCSHEYICDVLY